MIWKQLLISAGHVVVFEGVLRIGFVERTEVFEATLLFNSPMGVGQIQGLNPNVDRFARVLPLMVSGE